MRSLIEMRAAFKKLTSEQRIAWAVEENPDLMFEKVIVPASAMQKKTGITEPVVVAAE